MINNIFKTIGQYIILVLLQIGILNNIQMGGFVNPYLYVLFILLLPFETPGWIVLILSFFMGLTIDMFSDTLGMHTSATVFMGFMRFYTLGAIAPRDGYDIGVKPRIQYFGFIWFLKYAILLIFLHHLSLFTIEVFNFHTFHLVLFRTIISTLFTTLLVILSQYIIFRK